MVSFDDHTRCTWGGFTNIIIGITKVTELTVLVKTICASPLLSLILAKFSAVFSSQMSDSVGQIYLSKAVFFVCYCCIYVFF